MTYNLRRRHFLRHFSALLSFGGVSVYSLGQTVVRNSPKIFDVDPKISGALVLFGKVVTMTGLVINDGVVYTKLGKIVGVQPRSVPAPAGFEDAPRIETDGVIYPGLIDLHNHLNYNVLPLWHPPQKYGDRYEWRADSRYKHDISQPIHALVDKGLSSAIVRYVEAKLVVGGTTSAQGMNLAGDTKFYRGMVRNLEQTEDASLPEIATQLEDVFKLTDQQKAAIRQQLDSGKRLFHHLAEGRNQHAHQAYEDVRALNWPAVNYVGIHAVGLEPGEYSELAQAGASVVWSPTSNLLLYGKSLDVGTLVSSGLQWGLGCDWSPSGTKNPLGEMKVALLASQEVGINMSYKSLVEACTVRAAKIAGWAGVLGSITQGYLADLLVVSSKTPDVYENLVRATEKDIRLVTIAGVPRYGDEVLMRQTGIPISELELRNLAGTSRALYFSHPEAPSEMNALPLDKAIKSLEEGMSDLNAPPPAIPFFQALGFKNDRLKLALEMLPDTSGGVAAPFSTPNPQPSPLTSIPLDKLTAIDDLEFFDRLEAVSHAPAYLHRLRDFYIN